MDIDANVIIESLMKQVSNYAKQVAILEAQVVALKGTLTTKEESKVTKVL